MRLQSFSVLALAGTLSSCAAVRGKSPPSTLVNLGVATQYWFRGVPQSEEMVAQVDATMTVPLANDDTLTVTTWGNYQLSSSSGRAAFASGNGGDFSEVDVTATYAAQVDEVTVIGGVISYNFPNAIGLSTHEIFGGVTYGDANEFLAHTATVSFDIDQVDDFYASYGVAHTEKLDERFTANFSGLVGYVGEDQARFYFGDEHQGLSDASLTGVLTYRYDEFTHVFAKASVITVPDARLRDAESDRGFKTSTVVFTFGICWGL